MLSLLLWKERTIAFDAAFQVFSVINAEDYAIQVQRFGAVVVQSFPLLLTKAGASMNLILQSYSASFVFYPFVLFVLATTVLKSKKMGFSIVLFFLLMQVHTFYWIQSELIQACVFSLFFTSVFSKYPKASVVAFLGYALGAITILYAHPLGIVALLFGLGYLFIDDEKYRSRTFWGIILTIVIMAIYKYKFANLGTYDTKAFGMFDGFADRIGQIFSLPSTEMFFSRLLSTYYILGVAFITITVIFIKSKQWLKLAWVFIAIVGWLALILTTYHWGGEQFYIESFYLMLGLFIAIPIAWDFWPKIEYKYIAPLLLSIFIIVRVVQIWEAKTIYQDRLAWTTEKLDEMNTFEEQRFYIKKSNTPMYIIQLEWAMPYEMLLLSSLKEQDKGLKTLYIMQNDEDENAITDTKDAFTTIFGPVRYEWLGTRFPLHDGMQVKKLD